MGLFKQSTPNYTSKGYHRAFGDALGDALTKAHSTVISNGTALEHIIRDRCEPVRNVDDFLDELVIHHGVWLAHTRDVLAATTLNISRKGMPDLFVFKRNARGQVCYIIELKTGGRIDTKKAWAEIQSINNFASTIAKLIGYKVVPLHCGFFCETKLDVMKSYRGALRFGESIAGQELCDLLEIDYDQIVKETIQHQTKNANAFLKEIVNTPALNKKLRRMIAA